MIQADNLFKYFGDKCAVSGVSFSVQPGEAVVLLGPNGAGKTTVVRLVSGVLSPDQGQAQVLGFSTSACSASVRKHVGVLTELPGLYARMNLYEYLEFFGKLYDVKKELILERARALISLLELEDDSLKPLETYSKGMRQKASLARALIHNPPVVLLDEPTSALDPRSAKKVRDYVAVLKEQKKTVLICTHNLYEAEVLADRLLILQKGKLMFSGTVDKLKAHLVGIPRFKTRFVPNSIPEQTITEKLSKYARSLNLSVSNMVTKKDECIFSTKHPEKENPLILKFLLSLPVQVISCEPVSLSLEEAYLKFCGDQPGDS